MARPYPERPLPGGGRRAVETFDIATILLHPLAGVLSAWGIGLARRRCIRRQSLEVPLDDAGHAVVAFVAVVLLVAVVAAGISEALVTTAGGIAVAIEAVVIYNFMNVHVGKLALQLKLGGVLRALPN